MYFDFRKNDVLFYLYSEGLPTLTHTLTFRQTALGGDASNFIDNVRITSNPLPAVLIIDSFTTGVEGINTQGVGVYPVFSNFTGSGPVGNAREMRVRDGWSGTLGCCTNLDIDASAVLKASVGRAAPEQSIHYGTSIGGRGGWGANIGPDGPGTPVELNLELAMDDHFEVDVISNPHSISIEIVLLTGSSDQLSWISNPLSIGTTRVVLSDFLNASELNLDDVDGLIVRFNSIPDMTEGIIIDELRFIL
jgi:hypothetical protein